MNSKYKEIAIDTFYDFVGCMLMAMAVKIFSAPNQVAPGGVTGLATMLNHLYPAAPIGTTSLILNIPLLMLAYKKLGRRFTMKTAATTVMVTLAFDVFMANPPIYQGDAMLAALFGGILTGSGASLVYRRGSTAGGTDIVIKVIQKKRPHMSLGQLVLAINGVIILMAAVVYNNIEASLYGLVMTFTSGRVIDAMLYGADTGKNLMIITRKPDDIADAIVSRLKRSATIIPGKGAYRRDDISILMCVVRKQEFHPLKALINEVDPHSFIIVTEANQIIGTGFKTLTDE